MGEEYVCSTCGEKMIKHPWQDLFEQGENCECDDPYPILKSEYKDDKETN